MLGVTQSVTSSKDLWLRLFKHRVLRKICGPKREQVMGDWRKLLSEELHDLHSSLNTYYLGDNKTEIGGACGMYGGEMKYIQDFSEQTSRKETIGKTYA
jgi:hypothetical protein